jgi:uncharacterized membrane protein YedE/YeeE
MRSLFANVAMGLFFGIAFSRTGVHEFDHIHGMFTFSDFHMYGVLGSAVAVAAVGLFVFRKSKMKMANGLSFAGKRKELSAGNVPGGLLFGVGWAITGACPGTSFLQVGSGYLLGLATLAGLSVGVLVYRPVHKRLFSWEADTCG